LARSPEHIPETNDQSDEQPETYEQSSSTRIITELRAERDALSVQVERFEEKMAAAEQHHEATRRELDVSQTANDQLRQDHDHTQRLLENALDSIGSLTEQMKAQSMLQHQLQQHRALEAPPPEEPAKPGVLARWFGGRRKRHVRIGHA